VQTNIFVSLLVLFVINLNLSCEFVGSHYESPNLSYGFKLVLTPKLHIRPLIGSREPL
jgi:hypothetical protein